MVYFITDGFNTKIGKADNVERRIKELQTGNPRVLKVAFKFKGSFELEKDLQKMFQKHRAQAQNEWFALSPEQMAPMLMHRFGADIMAPAMRGENHYCFRKAVVAATSIKDMQRGIVLDVVLKALDTDHLKIKPGKIMKKTGISLTIINDSIKKNKLLTKIQKHNAKVQKLNI